MSDQSGLSRGNALKCMTFGGAGTLYRALTSVTEVKHPRSLGLTDTALKS
jgi:hypothetical protein